jgi:uncharacterized protein
MTLPDLDIDGPHISALWRYPVKGAAGEQLNVAELDARGIAGDRSFMLTRAGGDFVSARSLPEVTLLSAALTDDDLLLTVPSGENSAATFTMPRRQDGPGTNVTLHGNRHPALDVLTGSGEAGKDLRVALGEHFKQEVGLVRIPDDYERQVTPAWAGEGHQTGYADSAPVQLASATSLRAFTAHLRDDLEMPIEGDLDIRRFRPNALIDNTLPWSEDTIQAFRQGGTELDFGKPTIRCEVTKVNPDTGLDDLDLLAALTKFHRVYDQDGQRLKGPHFGVSLTHTPGTTLAVGMLELIPRPESTL